MIRLIEYPDAQEIFNLVDANRSFLREWLPWVDFNTSLEDTKKFISSSLDDYSKNKSMVNVVIQKGIVGLCAFVNFDSSIKAGYIGYWLAKDCQGYGYITEACKDLEYIGFNRLKLNKIEIHVAKDNQKSRAIALKLGYVETGVILDAEWLYDHYVDHIIYCKKNG